MSDSGLVPKDAGVETIGRLLGRIVHDFNNPLAAIIGFSDLLRSPNLSDEKRQRFVQRIHEQALRLGQLVETMSHYANMPSPEVAAIDMRRSVTDFLGLRQAGLDLLRVQLEVDIADVVPQAMGECGLINRVLSAMLNNLEQILKEHPDAPRKGRLALWADDEHVILDLIDSGPGVPEELKEEIFEPFFSTRRAGGLGLGLTVARSLSRRLGGDLLLVPSPSPEYAGACFRLMLKRAA